MGEILHFWPKNDGEKWSRKNIFEIPPCAHHFLLGGIQQLRGPNRVYKRGHFI